MKHERMGADGTYYSMNRENLSNEYITPFDADTSDADVALASLSDPSTYRIIIERYEARLARYLRRIGYFSREDIEDLLQEIFLKAYKGLNSYDSKLSFSSWIYRIAHNEAVSWIRKRSIRPEGHTNESSEEDLLLIPDVADTLVEAESKESARIVREALNAIDKKYRDIIILYDLEGMSYKDISDVLRIPPGTVATWLSRGRAELKKVLIQRGYSLQS